MIGGDDQLTNWQAHLAGQVAGVNVTKVACRHRKRYWSCGRAHIHCSIKIVDDLGHDASPVDRVDGYQLPVWRQERLVPERRFNDALTVIEIALYCDVVDVVAWHRRHLTALHLRHPLM